VKARALGALVFFGIAAGACRTVPSTRRLPSYVLDPRLGLEGPFPRSVEEGWRLLSSGRPEDALAAFQAGPGTPAARIGRIEAQLETKKVLEARAGCDSAFRDGIGTAPLLAACGEAAARQENWSDAFDLFVAASLRAPGLLQLAELKRAAAPRAAAELVAQGEQAKEENEMAEAENAADRALAIDATSLPALRLSAAAALAREDEAKALNRYRAAWELDRSDRESGEQAGDLALKLGRYDAAYQVFSALAQADPKYLPRAEECQEEFVISNWPAPDRASAHAARLTRAQAGTLLWRLLPEIRDVPLPSSAPIASDILSRPDQRILAHCLGIGLLTVDASTHRARPDVSLSRADAVRLLTRSASLTGRASITACVDEKAGADGVVAAASSCGLLPAGKATAVSAREFRRAIAYMSSHRRKRP
jgi:tetratricopeptide (TPR) repeat protein